MPGDRSAPAAEQRAVLKPSGDLPRAHDAHPVRGELDAQRQAVEPAADRGDGVRGRRVEAEVRRRGAGPLDEQRGGVIERQGRYRPHLLAVGTERFTTGREDHHPGAPLHDLADEPGGVHRQGLGAAVDAVLAADPAAREVPAGAQVLLDELLLRGDADTASAGLDAWYAGGAELPVVVLPPGRPVAELDAALETLSPQRRLEPLTRRSGTPSRGAA